MLKRHPFLPVIPSIWHYPWGKEGAKSEVWPFVREGKQDASNPYAEAWFGTHHSGTSQVNVDEELVSISEFIGTSATPLVKVVSVREPHAIQLHPTAKQAKKLHGQHPVSFHDALAVTKVGIALETVFMFGGLLSDSQFRKSMKKHPIPFEAFGLGRLPKKNIAYTCLKRLYELEETKVTEVLRAIGEEFPNNVGLMMQSSASYWASTRVYELPQIDRGIISLYFLNHFRLKAGQSIFIPAGVPYVYCLGDLVELSVPSYNVICGGFKSRVSANLFTKHIDPEASPKIVEPERGNGRYNYSYPEPLFNLSSFSSRQEGSFNSLSPFAPRQEGGLHSQSQQLLLCVGASGTLKWRGRGKRTHTFRGSHAFLIPNGERETNYTLNLKCGDAFLVKYSESQS